MILEAYRSKIASRKHHRTKLKQQYRLTRIYGTKQSTLTFFLIPKNQHNPYKALQVKAAPIYGTHFE
jgi:hypothetical protein